MKSQGGEGTLIGIPPTSPHSLFPPSGQHPVSQQSYIPGQSVLSADNKQPNNQARVTEALIKSPLVHWGGVSDPVPFTVGSLSCVRKSLLLLLLLLPPLLHIQASPAPRPPAPRQPQKRWLDSRDALILQPRQSRLHRWRLLCMCCLAPGVEMQA
ncbi:hypothetical protein PAMP_023233 [Pampus punctatissimus]